jgi:DNA-binding response OmpR family regulator
METKTDKNTTRPLLLLVDDVSENLQLLAQHLKDDYELAFATDGEQAITIAVETSPNLILLDIMMPGIDGIETCRRLKKMPATAAIPIIFLTARTELDDIVRGFEAGAMDYVGKPFKAAELRARVQAHVQLRSLKSLLSVCAQCHKIRNEKNEWERLDLYVEQHTNTKFSHGFCPDCFKKFNEEFEANS